MFGFRRRGIHLLSLVSILAAGCGGESTATTSGSVTTTASPVDGGSGGSGGQGGSSVSAGGTAGVGTAGAGGTGGAASGGGGAGVGGAAGGDCTTAPPGTSMTLHVRNAGTSPLVFTFGCHDRPRAYVETAGGSQRMWWAPDGDGSPIADEPKGHAGRTCEDAYAGKPYPFFTDCATGYGKTLAPGATFDLRWDRRGFAAHTVEPRCSREAPVSCSMGFECFSTICSAGTCENVCELATAVPPSTAQSGAIVVCDETFITGFCKTPRKVPFTIDTTADEATIDAK